jgi:hypothetical protein
VFEVDKCSLKYNVSDALAGAFILQHFDTEDVIILQTSKQKYYFDSTVGKYKVDFHPLRESKIYLIGPGHTPRYLIGYRRSVIYFLFMYVKNKIYICLY